MPNFGVIVLGVLQNFNKNMQGLFFFGVFHLASCPASSKTYFV
jgi:hypothetical protein